MTTVQKNSIEVLTINIEALERMTEEEEVRDSDKTGKT